MGMELLNENHLQEITLDTTFRSSLNDLQPTVFMESEVSITEKAALRLGLRGHYSTLQDEATISPRISAAYKTGTHSQVALAWGIFRQRPAFEYLLLAPELLPERSAHYILNYQYRKDRRMFRVEAYLKQYSQLVMYQDPYRPGPGNFSSAGKGFAKGLDVFWRDRASVRNLDYWISYSYLDTERKYQDFPSPAPPSYASAHNLSLVCKYFFTRIRTFAGLTYSFATPRPYEDKNSPDFMDGRTPSYHDLSLGLTHVTALFGKELVLHMNMINLLGTKNIFGYDYANTPDPDGHYASRPVVPASGRQAVLVVLISF
jgi:outer membrane receptor for ferrienterochelin and colicin